MFHGTTDLIVSSRFLYIHITSPFRQFRQPVMSGLEAVGQLRDAGREDFVVGVTGNALVSDQGECWAISGLIYESRERPNLVNADEYLAAGVNQ